MPLLKMKLNNLNCIVKIKVFSTTKIKNRKWPRRFRDPAANIGLVGNLLRILRLHFLMQLKCIPTRKKTWVRWYLMRRQELGSSIESQCSNLLPTATLIQTQHSKKITRVEFKVQFSTTDPRKFLITTVDQVLALIIPIKTKIPTSMLRHFLNTSRFKGKFSVNKVCHLNNTFIEFQSTDLLIIQ